MTRLPLTQPSTDLVEVTLDLILLIDQLLTVLRQRGALLDLTSYRLQWDDLRHEVSREADSVNAEIEHVVAEAQAWIPGQSLPERRASSKLSSRPMVVPVSGGSDAAQGPSTPPGSPKKEAAMNTSRKAAPPSPTKAGGGPKSALHLSILRSQLVGLQTRQRNFAYTLVKRSTAVLDKMIDAAARLDRLGGVTGPLDDAANSHNAVPEQLIELQEAIEDNAKGMSERVTWCSEFEFQCRTAHQHYVASLRAQHVTSEVLAEIERALTSSASSDQHTKLAKMYAEATSILPTVIDSTFPRPSHPDYPSKDEHNERLIDALQVARDSAQADVDLAGKALSFYSAMLKAREALLTQHQRVQALRKKLADTVDRLERGTASVPRPSLEDIAKNGGDYSNWLRSAAEWITTGDEVVRSATDTHQSTMLAAMQYRKSLVSAPMAVKRFIPESGVPDDLGPVVDDDAGDLISLARRCAELTKTTRTASEAIPLVLCIRQDSDSLEKDASSLQETLVLAVNQSAWISRASGNPPANLGEHVAALASRIAEADGELTRLTSMAGVPLAVSRPLEAKMAEARETLDSSRTTLTRLAQVSDQANVVRAIHAEAEDLLKAIDTSRGKVTAKTDMQNLHASVSSFKSRVASWNDTLAKRVVFVSDDPPTLDRRGSPGFNDEPLTPPLTPQSGVSAMGTTMPDFSALDGRVRNEVNRQSARVASALAHLSSAVDEVAFNSWADPVVKATSTLTSASNELGAVMSRLSVPLAAIKSTEGEERQTLVAEAKKTGREELPEHIIGVQQSIAALNEALGARGSHIVDTHRAADVFSSADVAREAGLGRIAETEEWQREVNRLALDADITLQRQKAGLLKQKADDAAAAASSKESAEARAAVEAKSAARELSEKLEALDLENVVRPSPASLRTTPKHRRLPTSTVAKQLASSFSSIKDSARSLTEVPKSPEVNSLLGKLKRAATLVPELDGLGVVSDAASVCDRAFSSLLEAIDSKEKEKIRVAEHEAASAVEAFKRAVKPHKLDQRVMSELKRIVTTWDDLRAMAREELAPSIKSSTASNRSNGKSGHGRGSSRSTIGRSATSSSISSILSEQTVKPAPKKAVRRVASNLSLKTAQVAMPPPDMKKAPTRSRISDTPTKPRTVTAKDVFDPAQSTPLVSRTRTNSSKSIMAPTIPQPFRFSDTPSGMTRSASATASLSDLATPTRTRGPRLSAPPRTPVLAPAPKFKREAPGATKLDEAVAQVLDTLDVSAGNGTSLTSR